MPYISVQNQRTHYSEHRATDAQESIPLVLVHGAGGVLYHWPPRLRRLAQNDVFAIDLPGHGRSQGGGRESMDEYVDFLIDWADALQLPPFVLTGHSMGGGIALTFALQHPQRLRGLGLVATGSRLRVHPGILEAIADDQEGVGQQNQEGVGQQNKERVGGQLVEWVHGHRATPTQRKQYLQHFLSVDTDVLVGDWLACDRFDVMHRIPEIQLPTLIITGSQDQMTPVRFASYMATEMPDADLTIIDGAGHMIMLEQPEMVTGAVAGFMERLRREV